MPTAQHIAWMTRRLSASGSGSTGTRAAVEIDIGSEARRSGSVVVPLEGAVIGDTVLASLLPGPYTDKGTLADEVEMDGLAVSARVPGNGRHLRNRSPRHDQFGACWRGWRVL